jgi:hypothetical protein
MQSTRFGIAGVSVQVRLTRPSYKGCMTLILVLGCLLAAGIAINDRLTDLDKILMVVVLGIICGIASLF